MEEKRGMPGLALGEASSGGAIPLAIEVAEDLALPFAATCPKCNAKLYDGELFCTVDSTFIGFPNVRAAVTEQDALKSRYHEAKSQAATSRTEKEIASLEMMTLTCTVVVNAEIALAHRFIGSNLLFRNYEQQVNEGGRLAAVHGNDCRRRLVGSALFGSHANRICYGALSPDGWGPMSYGKVSLELKAECVAKRASLLIENSYTFVNQYKMSQLPQGVRATWPNRDKLAVVKLVSHLRPGCGQEELAKLLLHSEGKRETDKFIEVHVYGSIDWQTVAKIRIPALAYDNKLEESPKLQESQMAELKERAEKHNIPVEQR